MSAEDEARFGYVAAVNTTTLSDGVVLDIGGGSLQLTEVHDRHAGASASFPIGAVRMTEQFLAGLGTGQEEGARPPAGHVREQLASLDWLKTSGRRLVGIGGAVRNLAAAALRDRGADRHRRPGLRDQAQDAQRAAGQARRPARR